MKKLAQKFIRRRYINCICILIWNFVTSLWKNAWSFIMNKLYTQGFYQTLVFEIGSMVSPLGKGNKEVGPLTAKLALSLIKFMKYGIVHFLLYEKLEESPNCVYIPNIHC